MFPLHKANILETDKMFSSNDELQGKILTGN